MNWMHYIESLVGAVILILISFMLVNWVKTNKKVEANIKQYELCIDAARTVSGIVGNTRPYDDCKLEMLP